MLKKEHHENTWLNYSLDVLCVMLYHDGEDLVLSKCTYTYQYNSCLLVMAGAGYARLFKHVFPTMSCTSVLTSTSETCMRFWLVPHKYG